MSALEPPHPSRRGEPVQGFRSPPPTGDEAVDAVLRRRAHARDLNWCPSCRASRPNPPAGALAHRPGCPIGDDALAEAMARAEANGHLASWAGKVDAVVMRGMPRTLLEDAVATVEGCLLEAAVRESRRPPSDVTPALILAYGAIDRAVQFRATPLPYVLLGDEPGQMPVWAVSLLACALVQPGDELAAVGDESIRDLAGAVHSYTVGKFVDRRTEP